MSIFGNKRRDDEPDPTGPPRSEAGTPEGKDAKAPAPPPSRPKASSPTVETKPMKGEGAMANIGKSISIKGDLTGEEDLLVEGRVEGKIDLPQNELTIGPAGNVEADIHAKSVLVTGRVAGNVSASERVEIKDSGRVEGDVRAPRLVVQEGATVNGSIHMAEKAAGPSTQPGKPASAKPAGAGTGPGGPSSDTRPSPPPA